MLREKKKQLDKDPFALYRINHVSWWERELPSEDEMKTGLDKSDYLTDYLQKIKQTVDYKHWLFGHMHINQTFQWERSSCLYEQIIRFL